jgi:ADP-heptose:LPS heptosyltransferase
VADVGTVKVLVTCPDQLVDLIFSAPVFEYLSAPDPGPEVHALVPSALVPLVENDPHLAGIWTWPAGEPSGYPVDLEAQLRAEGFEAAIMLDYRRDLALLMRRAGIKQRHGYWSRPSSWFLLNKGSLKDRSGPHRHEIERYLNLVGKFRSGSAREVDALAPRLYLTEGQRDLGRDFRTDFQVGTDKLVFLHPGSSEEDLQWDPGRFSGVANTLAKMDGFRVFVTGMFSDDLCLAKVSVGLDSDVTILVGQDNLRDYLGVLSAGDYFAGPSSEPLHLASALGLGTVGLFLPVESLGPNRRGVRGKFSESVVPRVDCPEGRQCRLERCTYYNCMDGIFERDVLGAILDVHRRKTEADLVEDAAREEKS